jgi:hypothetical protein
MLMKVKRRLGRGLSCSQEQSKCPKQRVSDSVPSDLRGGRLFRACTESDRRTEDGTVQNAIQSREDLSEDEVPEGRDFDEEWEVE